MMNKIMIIGNCGAGKSTLAKQLAYRTGLPLIHLDREYYEADWKCPEKEKWNDKVLSLISKPRWILDGNYISSMEIRLKEADLIVFLDIDKWTCLFSVLKRIIQSSGTRDDMTIGCKERLDTEFLRYVWNYNRKIRPRVYDLLDINKEAKLVILKSRKEIRRFIA